MVSRNKLACPCENWEGQVWVREIATSKSHINCCNSLVRFTHILGNGCLYCAKALSNFFFLGFFVFGGRGCLKLTLSSMYIWIIDVKLDPCRCHGAGYVPHMNLQDSIKLDEGEARKRELMLKPTYRSEDITFSLDL